jgi:uncharacterized protein YbjT (DUF2867 family)
MNIGKDLILVTGATGRQGGAVAHELLANGHKVRAMTRHPEGAPAQALAAAGAEVVAGDLDDEASLGRAVQGAWGLYAVQNTWEAGVEREEAQGKRLAKVAREGGVQHYVQGSVGSAHRRTGIPHFENKWRIEETVRALKFPSYAVIRPVFYMENFLMPQNLAAVQQGRLDITIAPETRLQMVAVSDIGKHGRRAFERHEELNGQGIDVAGDEPTMPQVADALTQATGQKVTFAPSPIEAIRKFSEDYAAMLEWFDRVGYDVDIERLAKESGIAPTRFSSWASRVEWAASPAPR